MESTFYSQPRILLINDVRRPINKKPLAHWNVNNNLSFRRKISALTEALHKINDLVWLLSDLDNIMDTITTIHWHFMCTILAFHRNWQWMVILWGVTLGMQQVDYTTLKITFTISHWNCVQFYEIWLIIIINLGHTVCNPYRNCHWRVYDQSTGIRCGTVIPKSFGIP